jgi:hypothetical protein
MENNCEFKLQATDNLYEGILIFEILRIFTVQKIKHCKYSTTYKCQRSSAKARTVGKAETKLLLVDQNEIKHGLDVLIKR